MDGIEDFSEAPRIGNQNPYWQWIVGILIFVVVTVIGSAVGGYIASRNRLDDATSDRLSVIEGKIDVLLRLAITNESKNSSQDELLRQMREDITEIERRMVKIERSDK